MKRTGPKRKLSLRQQVRLRRLLLLRREITNKSLAKRFGLSLSGIDDYQRRFIVKGEAPRL